jgi:hypothetical protein
MTSRGRLCCLLVALAEAQSTFKLDSLVASGVTVYPGVQVTVTFRGTVFTCIIEGVYDGYP